jgi:CubicO group peptidase (beta-lactamase class C family)
MGKMFTAVAVVQLAQAGRLDLDATVGTYLPDYPNAAFAHTVTLRQLLTHTGGAGDFMSQAWADNYQALKSPADYIALFGTRAPGFTPGSRFAYANYGFVVLGRVVEAVSGQGYEDYLRDHVFGPAGMSHSGLSGAPDKGGVLATRYVKTAAGYNPPPAPFTGAATPAGGAYSTVGDMLAFAQALTGHRLLDATHTELLLTGKVTSESGRYALGFQDRSAEGRRDVGHDGGGPGENGCFRMLDGDRVTIIAFSNVAPTWRADKLCAFIAARLDTR